MLFTPHSISFIDVTTSLVGRTVGFWMKRLLIEEIATIDMSLCTVCVGVYSVSIYIYMCVCVCV